MLLCMNWESDTHILFKDTLSTFQKLEDLCQIRDYLHVLRHVLSGGSESLCPEMMYLVASTVMLAQV